MIAYTDRQRLEAAEWFMDIHDADDPSPELLQRWTRWLEAAEGNRLAFEAVERAWHQIPDGLEFPEAAESYWPAGRNVSKPLAYAATFALAVVATGWLVDRAGVGSRPASGEFSTRTGEHMNLTLADGSRITLGARSRLIVDFSDKVRDIRLHNGEAFFSVHKDLRRPFNVRTAGGVVTAVGTAFNVRANGSWLTVAVTEGVVNVENKLEEGGARHLAPGQQLTVTTEPSRSAGATLLTNVDPAQPGRWRDGWLVYQDEPLSAVVADISRYTDRKISLLASVDPTLRFTGAVYRDSVLEWIEALPDVFPVAVDSTGEEIRVQ